MRVEEVVLTNDSEVMKGGYITLLREDIAVGKVVIPLGPYTELNCCRLP